MLQCALTRPECCFWRILYKHCKTEYRTSCEEYRTRDDNSKRSHFFHFFFKSIHPFLHPRANLAAAFLNLSTNSMIILSTIQVGKQISVNHRLTKIKTKQEQKRICNSYDDHVRNKEKHTI